MIKFEKSSIIAAVYSDRDFEEALKNNVEVIILLRANLLTLHKFIESAHKNQKMLFVHADMTEGITKDDFGIAYIAKAGADGIVSTRSNLIKTAKKSKLMTVQRVFAIDSKSVSTAIETAKSCKPDMIEIMPGIIPKVIARFKGNVNIPLIMGGFIETKEEIAQALSAGAHAVSTSRSELWNW